MDDVLKDKLVALASDKIMNKDTSHDFRHALRVLANAEMIAGYEKADMDIVVPAALFHDMVVYPKNSPKSKKSADESAEKAQKILTKINSFPREKIKDVCDAIRTCSFSKGIVPSTIEAKILQDADGLEATGAVSVMRTFSSTGQMKRLFYALEDPFCRKRKPDDLKYAIDLFYTRLLKVAGRMHTKSARKIAERRTVFLREFLKEIRLELDGK